MLWENRGQKIINQKTDSLYRVLYNLKIGVRKSTNKFTKKVFRIPNTMSPMIVWYKGDETIHASLPYGNGCEPLPKVNLTY